MPLAHHSRDDGFSLVEMMFVVAILGVLVCIAVGTYKVSTTKAEAVTCSTNVETLNVAVQVYEAEHRVPPPNIDALSPYVSSRNAMRCPSDDRPYAYNPVNRQVSCPNHPQQ